MWSPTFATRKERNWIGYYPCSRALKIVLSGLIVVCLFQPALAQDYSQAIGMPTFTTAEPVELGFVNAANGNLHLEIPVASFPQRGAKPLTYKLVYDSRIWYLNSGTTWDPNGGPWRSINSAGLGSVNLSVWSSQFCNVNGHQEQDQGANNFSWQAPDGTTHYFNITLQYTNNCGGQIAFCGSSSAVDASGYYMIQNDATSCQGQWPLGTTILAPDGTQIYTGCTSCSQGERYYDTNGNYFSSDSNGNTIDTVGRTPVIVTSNCGTNETCYDVLNSQGGSTRSRWIVTTESIAVHTAFGGTGVQYQGNITVTQSIKAPDGTSYSFTYDSGTTSGHFGELTGITLPNGGQISYGYTVYTDALNITNHWVSKHISGGGTTTYTLGSVNTSNYTQSVTVTKPSGDYKVYAYALVNGGAWKNQVNYYSNGGSLLETVSDSWTQTPFGVLKGSETLALQTPGGSVTKQSTFAYANAYNPNVSTVKEWNYYTGSPSSTPNRITNITYLSDTNSAYAPGNGPGSSGRNIINLPSSIVVTDGNSNKLRETDYSYDTTTISSKTGIAHHDDSNFGAGFTTRGNRTLVKQWTSGTNYLTVATMNYDMTGKMASSTDANSNTTSYSYTDCYLTGNPPTTTTPSPATNAFLTTATLPVSGTTKACYYYNTGKTAWTKDQNSATTSYFYVVGSSNDPFDRLITETLPTGGWVLNNFSTPTTTVDTYTGIQDTSPSINCVSCRHDQVLLDGLARPTDQILVNDPDGLTTVHTDYDTNGRVLDTSHPYRSTSDSTYGFETPSYDGMNRTIQVLHEDGTKGHIYYGAAVAGAGGLSSQACPTGTCNIAYPTLTVDESGKMRQTWTDGFGNLVETDEPTASATAGTWGSSPTTTYYLYDLLGNLLQATVVGSAECNRTYLYDALSRTTQSTEPEPGKNGCTDSSHTTNYYYTTSTGAACSGNPSLLCRRTDGRSTTTTYTFDALNRPTGMTYSDSTPSVTYSYDQTSYNGLTITNGLGRRTGMSDGSGLTAWSYDANGNILTEERKIGSITKSTSYTYNKDNTPATLTYPSGRALTFTASNAQRITKVVDGNGTQYALPPSSGWMYAPTGALASAIYGKTGTFTGITETRTYNNRLQLTGVSATSSGGTPLNLAPGYNANGEVATITDSLDTGRTQSFTYDSLSRITAGSSGATSGADCWGQTFTIDNVANLTNIALSKCSGGSFSAAVNQNNQFTTGYTYDGAGNLTNDGIYTYAYNAENEITSANGVTYTYDGNYRRVEKSSGTLYWRNVGGNTIAETNLSGTDVNEYVFFAGRRVARIDSSGNVYYYQADQIGSTRTGTNSSGTLCYDADFTPYGSEMAHTTTCAQNYKFTGYERDSETGLDYAMNRYYNSRIGRFMSADPSGIASASPNNPQSLHRYAYVLNNPLGGIDPLGLACVFLDSGGDSVEEVDPTSTDYDSASCLHDGGVYFQGNDYLDPNSYIVSSESGWVGLFGGENSLLQAACSTGTDCTDQELANFAGPGTKFAVSWIVSASASCGDACEYTTRAQTFGDTGAWRPNPADTDPWGYPRNAVLPTCSGALDQGSCVPPPGPNCEGWKAVMETVDDVGWLWSPFTLGASHALGKEINTLNDASGLCK
jgi:RHS repeat-associated protein